MKIQVNSEIGCLKKVLVHRPGKEVERLYPELFERLLFDDIMYLPVAQKEHDAMVSKLENEGIEVFYLENLVAEALDSAPKSRQKFVNDFLKHSEITSSELFDLLAKFLLKQPSNLALINMMIAGIKKNELVIKNPQSLELKIIMQNNYPFLLDPIPNVLFQRDPIVNIFNSNKINYMAKETRNRERLFYQQIFDYHPEWKANKSIVPFDQKGSMEGGDVLVINKKTLFIGLSQRTTPLGIENLAKELFLQYENLKNIIAIQIPKERATMHLDTVLTQMDYDKWSIDAEMSKVPYHVFEITFQNNHLVVNEKITKIQDLIHQYSHSEAKFIVVGNNDAVNARREQWNDGANCLCIRPGTIVVYDRNYKTNQIIKDSGVKIIEVPSSELSRGRGGPRCMTMPIEREDVKEGN